MTATRYFSEWRQALQVGDPAKHWRKFLRQSELPPLDFSFEASAVFSANIEGNTVDLNFYANSKFDRALAKFKRKEIAEIDALVEAYRFAQSHRLNEKNLLMAHQLASKTILPKPARAQIRAGRYRTTQVFVLSEAGIEYAAIEPQFVAEKMRELSDDVRTLLRSPLSTNKVFYHAALLHLIFAHIHPFADGNGRMARLVEKWFLAEWLGVDAWHIPSEKYYRQHLAAYYRNIKLGANYYVLDYDRCVPFLTMLAKTITGQAMI